MSVASSSNLQLHNLGKHEEICSSAIEVLKLLFRDLDSQIISGFIHEVYLQKEHEVFSLDGTILLYEVMALLARHCGADVFPHIDTIVYGTVATLISSSGSSSLQLACSKVISAVATHLIEPTFSQNMVSEIICGICTPLSYILTSSSESAASGSALCLKSLVECESWRFVTEELLNEVCSKVATALEDFDVQTDSLMGLAIALAKRNSCNLQCHAKSIIKSGIRILKSSSLQDDLSKLHTSLDIGLHKRLTTIDMINCMINSIDSNYVLTEMGNIVDVMEALMNSDPTESVKQAASEARRNAKRMCFIKDPPSVIPYVQNNSPIVGNHLTLAGNSAHRPRNSTVSRNCILAFVVGLCLALAAVKLGLLSDNEGEFACAT